MHKLIIRTAATALLLPALAAGCSKLGLGGAQPGSKELPTARQLRLIHYMSQAPGADGRRMFNHLAQAKSCRDFEIAMRWNRPPDMRGGPFDKKMIYVTSSVPKDLEKDSEVFISGEIKQGQSMPSGGSVWSLRLRDGAEVQAVETAEYSEKQDEAQQAGGHATMIHPYTHGRVLCAYGIYQGNTGTPLKGPGHVPLVSILFAMDRIR